MGFFDAAIEAASRDAARASEHARRRPPPPGWNDLPASVPFEGVIWRGLTAAAAISTLVASPDGFGFTVQARWHDEVPQTGQQEAAFTVTLVLADGRQAPEGRLAREFAEPELTRRGWQGGGGRYAEIEARYWAIPLPPPGPLTLVFAWPTREPAHASAPVRVSLDTAAILDAAGRTQHFFDVVPGLPEEQR